MKILYLFPGLSCLLTHLDRRLDHHSCLKNFLLNTGCWDPFWLQHSVTGTKYKNITLLAANHCVGCTQYNFSICRVQFTNLSDSSKPGQAKLLPASSPHLVTCVTCPQDGKDDLLYTCQDMASNNLMGVSVEDLELHV